MKESHSNSSQDVKSTVQFFEQENEIEDTHEIAINNREELAESLKKSYLNPQNSSYIGMTINNFSYFLQAFWQQIIPSFIKGKAPVQLQNKGNKMQLLSSNKVPIIPQGSLLYSLQICCSSNQLFIIAVYKKQAALIKLLTKIEKTIKKYFILPIKNTNYKQLQLLTIKANFASETVFYVCKFNFAKEIIIFCEIDGTIGDDDFKSIFMMAELTVKDYNQFEESCLIKFKENIKNQKQNQVTE